MSIPPDLDAQIEAAATEAGMTYSSWLAATARKELTVRSALKASVVEGALRRAGLVISPDREDLEAIARAVGRCLEVEETWPMTLRSILRSFRLRRPARPGLNRQGGARTAATSRCRRRPGSLVPRHYRARAQS